MSSERWVWEHDAIESKKIPMLRPSKPTDQKLESWRPTNREVSGREMKRREKQRKGNKKQKKGAEQQKEQKDKKNGSQTKRKERKREKKAREGGRKQSADEPNSPD